MGPTVKLAQRTLDPLIRAYKEGCTSRGRHRSSQTKQLASRLTKERQPSHQLTPARGGCLRQPHASLIKLKHLLREPSTHHTVTNRLLSLFSLKHQLTSFLL
ncbi:hypothetical protein KFK09_012122 [Dendrobium nobile]|uniref:Uncharacterized protein n=1 Tax=Dendrobium nobile TaxID=94219 RepID=A0A8T3BEI2_DENNO|nr:hypothetical protein KFK09_012122 [Dendrobium nobile]